MPRVVMDRLSVAVNPVLPQETIDQLDELTNMLRRRYGSRQLGRSFAAIRAIEEEVRRRKAGDYPNMDQFTIKPGESACKLNLPPESREWLKWLARYDARHAVTTNASVSVSMQIAVPRELAAYRRSLDVASEK